MPHWSPTSTALALAAGLPAQTGTGTIEGRVLNARSAQVACFLIFQ